MKKNNFLNGAVIATAGIFICKIIGLFYVIPFYGLIGVAGGALYSYAYSIYSIFLNLSTQGIPVAISKVVSEYNALKMYNTKERAFKIGHTIMLVLCVLSFIIMFTFAPQIANILKGGVEEGSKIADIALVIRVVSTALLIVPTYSVTKGYLQGHKMMTPSSIANVIEQLVRVIFLLVGAYFVLIILHLDIKYGVSIAVFAATVGALSGYLYLRIKMHKARNDFHKDEEPTKDEKKITTKDLALKIVKYAIPFVLVDLVDSAYVVVNSSTIVKTLTSVGYLATDAELVLSSIATWATKLNMIVISISSGFVISLIPHITSSFAKKDMDEVRSKSSQALEMLLLFVVPLSLGLVFMAGPMWTIFYKYNTLSISVFRLYAFQALTYSVHWLLVNLLQSLNKSKVALSIAFGSLLAKILLNVPAMKYIHLIGIPNYQGATIVTLLIQVVSIAIMFIYLAKEFKITFKGVRKNILMICLSSLAMIGVLYILSYFVSLNVTTRFSAILVTALYVGVGALVFLPLAYKAGLLNKFIKIFLSKKKED